MQTLDFTYIYSQMTSSPSVCPGFFLVNIMIIFELKVVFHITQKFPKQLQVTRFPVK